MSLARWTVLLGSVALVGAACGTPGSSATPSGPTAPPRGAPGQLVRVTQSSSAVSVVGVGGVLEVELTSGSYGRDGRIVPWAQPVSDTPAVLAPRAVVSGVRCPPDATCSFFAARATGNATVTAVGPSGILCARDGTRCVGVAAVLRRFAVRVSGP